MRLDTSGRLPRLFFTDVGLAELRAMTSDRRLADPVKFAHVRQELERPAGYPNRRGNLTPSLRDLPVSVPGTAVKRCKAKG
jgi:hypothetical protein